MPQNAENTALYKNNGITIKLYGVRNETKYITSRGHNKMVKIITYFIGIFFIVNHHCIKLQDMTRNFYTHLELDYTVNLPLYIM